MNRDFQQQAKLQRTAAILTIAVVLAVVLFIDHLKSRSTSMAAASSSSSTPATPATATPSAASPSSNSAASTNSGSPYKDGTYAAESQYSVPHSYESIKVTLTVKNGVVTSSQVANSEGDPKSAAFQEDFASEYESYVVGKSLSGLNLSGVAGASDTTAGFDQAVNSIRSQAQA